MMITVKSLAAAALLIAVSLGFVASASADEQWYMYHGGSHACSPASEHKLYQFRSPLALEQFARNDNTIRYIDTKISRHSDGTLAMATVHLNMRGEEGVFAYFRDRALCDKLTGKVLGTPSELQ
jgi:hypothetical protein